MRTALLQAEPRVKWSVFTETKSKAQALLFCYHPGKEKRKAEETTAEPPPSALRAAPSLCSSPEANKNKLPMLCVV